MKRRDFIKSVPAAALLPVISHELAEEASAVEAAQPKGIEPSEGGEQPKGFSVKSKTVRDAGAYEHVQCDQFGVDFKV